MESDLVGQFTSITGSTPSLAEQYLRLGDRDLEQAIGLFFANEGAELEPVAQDQATTSIPPASSATRHAGSGRVDGDGVVHIDSDDGEDNVDHTGKDESGGTGLQDDPSGTSRRVFEPAEDLPSETSNHTIAENPPFEDDEAIARRLQEEFYGANRTGGPEGGTVDEFGYRAPIARTTQTLVGPDSYDLSNAADLRAAAMEQMMVRRQPRPRDRPGIFNQDAAGFAWNEAGSSSRRDLLAQSTGGASESSSKANTLAEMYRPPFELISRMSWDEAREEGRNTEKWILVNIQDPSIFDCQLLNRDLWKHPGITETVKENFFFMQYSKDNPRGNQYIQYYFPNKDVDSAYPHIAIVDPRTGEQVKVWSGPPPPKAMDFLMQLHEFLDRYSLKASAKNPVAKRKPPPRKEVELDRMTEEQQMAMALQASLAGASSEARESDPDDLTRSIGNLDRANEKSHENATSPKIMAEEANGTAETATNAAFVSISSSHPHVEPPADATLTTRIQFRHPNGRVVRRFALADPVRRIFEWLKASPIEGKQDVEFDLIFMQKNLLTVLDETVGEAGLRNGTVMVEFNEET